MRKACIKATVDVVAYEAGEPLAEWEKDLLGPVAAAAWGNFNVTRRWSAGTCMIHPHRTACGEI